MANPAPEWTLADLAIVAPEFAAVLQATFDFWANEASGQIARARFGDRAKLAGCYLTAHLLTLNPPAGVDPSGAHSPALSSESVGGVAVSYAVKQFGADALSLSRYGLEFKRLARMAGCGGATAGACGLFLPGDLA